MNRLVPMFALLLAGCPDDDTNPRQLWIAPDGSELDLQLIDHEPPPF